MGKLKQKPIAPRLKEMEIGDQEDYPIARYSSLRTSVERIQKLRKKFSTKKKNDEIYTVTRIS